MITMLLFIAALAVLGFAAVRWGKDSREGLESKEWEYRRHQLGVE